MTQEERYRQVQLDRFNRSGEGVQDFSGPLAPGVGRDAIDASVKKGATDLQNNSAKSQIESAPAVQSAGEKIGGQMASSSAQQGNMAGTIGGAAMMTGNPYLMAGGLGLTVLAAGEQNRRAEEEAQRKAYNDKIAARQTAMANIASMGIQ